MRTIDRTFLPATVEYRRPDFSELCNLFDEVYPDYASAEYPPDASLPDGTAAESYLVFALSFGSAHEDPAEDIFEQYARRNLANRRLATFEEMVAFSRRYPDLQRRYTIGVLGTLITVDGDVCLPLLEGNEKKRVLALIVKSEAASHCDCILTVLL